MSSPVFSMQLGKCGAGDCGCYFRSRLSSFSSVKAGQV